MSTNDGRFDRPSPVALVELGQCISKAKTIAKAAGTLSTREVVKLARQLAYETLADDPSLAFRPGGDKWSPHRVIVGIIETDGTVTMATLAHCRQQAALWQLRRRIHGMAGALQSLSDRAGDMIPRQRKEPDNAAQ